MVINPKGRMADTGNGIMIIGFTGSIGSGCTTAARHLEKALKFSYISISNDVLSLLAKQHEIPFDKTEDKQDAGDIIRKFHLEEYQKLLLSKADETNAERGIVIECFRNPVEIEVFRNQYPHFYLIALYAPLKSRENRKKIDSFSLIDNRDQGEQEEFGQQVVKCVQDADIILDNSVEWSTTDKVDEFFEKLRNHERILEVPFRSPTREELSMHLAYSTRLLSDCIGRQVGAVITDENFRVLSTGYNCPPQASETCLDLYQECFRKKKKREMLSGLAKKVSGCPFCLNKFTGEEKPTNGTFICPYCKKNIGEVFSPGKELDYCRALHAEENAILSNPYTADLFYKKDKSLILFTSTFPCMLCAKKIANSGIQKVVFVEPYPMPEAYEILKDNKVKVKAFEGVKSLKFNWIFRKRDEYIERKAIAKKEELLRIKGGG